MEPFGAFDIIVALVLGWGVYRGRKRGMSMELLPVLECLIIVVAGAEIYKFAGEKLASATSGSISLLLSYIIAYVLFIIVVHMIFARLKTAVGEKLVGSDMFGSMEYYLGMLAGMIRYAAIIVIFLALLNAKVIDDKADAESTRVQIKELGKKYFPNYGDIQRFALHKSVVGKFMRDHLNHLLIKPTPSGTGAPAREPIARKRERAIDEVMDSKPKKE